MKQAIGELNEYYKEKDMKEDRYEFDLSEWKIERSYRGDPLTLAHIVLTRKKPKVEDRENIPVKVEWSNCSRFGDGMGENGIDFTRYGYKRYHIVQFRVTGFDDDCASVEYFDKGCLRSLLKNTDTTFHNIFDSEGLYIGRDAIGKWSTPVLLPESIYSKLDDICRALENRANEVKG